MTPPPATEILVHVAAASRASDDARYRALAQAYAAFEPARRVVVAAKSSGGSINSPTVSSFGECRQPASSILQVTTASTRSNDGGRSFQFANLSFESVWDNVESPALPSGVTRPTLGKQAPHNDRLHYVSPDDYIPDSQPDNDSKTRRHRVSIHKVEESIDNSTGFCESRISEPQKTSGSEESVINETTNCVRREASPDLSVMPEKRINDTFDETFDDLQSQRQPLSQRSANMRQSSQNEGIDVDSSFKSSPPLHDWDTVPSLDSGNRQPTSYPDIPSSLPEESGRVVLRVEASSYERQGLLDSLPSSCALKSVRADSEPLHNKRQCLPSRLEGSLRRRASDTGQLLLKKKCLAPATEGLETLRDAAEEADVVDELSGIDLHVFRTLIQRLPSSSPTASAPGLYLDQSLRIISPEPPVACAHLDAASLITEKMAKLARDLDITRRYRPLPPKARDGEREARPFERGYWRLSTSGWPATLRQQAWAFLASYIGAGDAGWSVWCSRDPAPHTWLRLHCFAATAGHTYLILYLASQRQILATGAEWMDGAGSPMIIVPARRKKQNQGGVFMNEC
ncbi:hypothetical protein SBRCBS47491_001040 [Sporothrix bragantina]|uniref:Uncharacterized protein n=1 Tax=Sporothrix bragantina TaxID=671064 RepID=A0ABP0AVC1_9PEZI